MDVNARIEKMLIRYLLEEKDIVATTAWFGDTEGPYDDGCDTCGHGSTEMSFEIYYNVAGSNNRKWIDVEGDPLGFFPTLLEYDVM
jgi:hypothetical protein